MRASLVAHGQRRTGPASVHRGGPADRVRLFTDCAEDRSGRSLASTTCSPRSPNRRGPAQRRPRDVAASCIEEYGPPRVEQHAAQDGTEGLGLDLGAEECGERRDRRRGRSAPRPRAFLDRGDRRPAPAGQRRRHRCRNLVAGGFAGRSIQSTRTRRPSPAAEPPVDDALRSRRTTPARVPRRPPSAGAPLPQSCAHCRTSPPRAQSAREDLGRGCSGATRTSSSSPTACSPAPASIRTTRGFRSSSSSRRRSRLRSPRRRFGAIAWVPKEHADDMLPEAIERTLGRGRRNPEERSGRRAVRRSLVQERVGADAALDVGDRHDADGPPGGVDHHDASRAQERRPREQLGDRRLRS